MHRLPVRRLAPFVLVAVALAGCSSVGESPAATVNGQEISVDSVRSELKTIRSNRAYRSALERSYQMTLAGTSKGTFDATFTAQVLTLRVYYELVEQSFDDLGITVTKKGEKDARETIKEQVDSLGENVWTRLPQKYRLQLGHQEALIEKASDSATEGKIGRRYFDAHKADFLDICVSHILVSSADRSEDEAERMADEIKTELDGGADFVELAKARSEDPGSKDSGGDLDCDKPGRFVDEFDKATKTQPVGEVGEPVKTQFGYHVILVRSRKSRTFEDVSQDPVLEFGRTTFEDYLIKLICGKKTDVDVNPSYGRWDRSTCKGGAGLAQVTAPKKPKSTKSTSGGQ